MKISLDLAEQEFKRFCEMMDLDDDLDDDAKKQKNLMLRAIQKGSLVVDDKGQPIFTPQRSEDKEPITFYEPEGSSLMAMDKSDDNEKIKKLFLSMADATHTSSQKFSKMKSADLKVCMAIYTLFLG